MFLQKQEQGFLSYFLQIKDGAIPADTKASECKDDQPCISGTSKTLDVTNSPHSVRKLPAGMMLIVYLSMMELIESSPCTRHGEMTQIDTTGGHLASEKRLFLIINGSFVDNE